jgi:hypothetical protein
MQLQFCVTREEFLEGNRRIVILACLVQELAEVCRNFVGSYVKSFLRLEDPDPRQSVECKKTEGEG